MSEQTHVLVVEDDPALRKLVAAALGKAGYVVELAENGLEALVALDAAPVKPSLLIIDIMMPELDGLSLVRALKTQPATRNIPVMFVTAKTDSKTLADGINAGAKYFLSKPFVVADLLAKVKRAIGG